MALSAEILISAPPEKIWPVLTDIEGSVDTISGITGIEILEQPQNGLKGLKWKETRTLFGREATEIMWITDVEEGKSYRTRAEHDQVIYISSLSLEEAGDQTRLVMNFEAEIQSALTRIISSIMGIFFNKATRDAMQQDLVDIKAHVEGS